MQEGTQYWVRNKRGYYTAWDTLAQARQTIAHLRRYSRRRGNAQRTDMDELTQITFNAAGCTITTEHGLVLAKNASVRDALRALWHRGLAPLAA